MRIFVVILLLPFCLKAQLFTETFSNFFPDTSAGNIIAADKNAAIRVYASMRVKD